MTIPLSVILSVWNDEKHIAQTIESILKQTFADFEFIIINDGSTDKTQTILDGYRARERRIKLINLPARSGLTKALNQGLALAEGQFIARHDSGDLSSPERFEEQLEYLKRNQNIAACFSWAGVISDDDISLGEFVFNHRPRTIKRRLLEGNNIFIHGSVMMRRDALTAVNGYDDAIKASQDFDLWLRMLKAGFFIGAVPKILYYWRLDPLSISISKGKKQDFYRNMALNRYYQLPDDALEQSKVSEQESDDATARLQRYYLNLFWRVRNKQQYLASFKYLWKKNLITSRDILKAFLIISPFDYRYLLRYF